MAPVIYHAYRRYLLRHIGYSTVVGFAAASAYWHLVAVPRVERRNLVMSLIEEERTMKQVALSLAETEFPGQLTVE